MKDFQIMRHKDGSWALLTALGERALEDDDPQDPVQVWATAKTESGQEFYVRVPVRRAMLEQEPQIAEERLRMFAEMWEKHNGQEGWTVGGRP